jgi:hypothetical protein
VFAGAEIDHKLAVSALDHGVDKALDGPAALEVAPSLDTDPDFMVKTGDTD